MWGNFMLEVTKEFRYESAHFLAGYDGPCRHIHGHSYRLLVTLGGAGVVDRVGDPKLGMLVDFTEVKKLVQDRVVSFFDHALVVPRGSWADCDLLKNNTVVRVVDFQPTCENMLVWISERLSEGWPEGVHLRRLRLYETSTNYAEWVCS